MSPGLEILHIPLTRMPDVCPEITYHGSPEILPRKIQKSHFIDMHEQLHISLI